MKRAYVLIPLFFLLIGGCASSSQSRRAAEATISAPEASGVVAAKAVAPLTYVVDLNDRADDLFNVTLSVSDLEASNNIYHFASTAPGTYQVMDMGRFVRSFEAYNAAGDVIPTDQITTNQWSISSPEDVRQIKYTVAETWDTPVEEHPVYAMAGSSIEDDHVVINGQTVFGFPEGMQDRPLRVYLEYPEEWVVGTALAPDDAGYYSATDYDHVVDSPIMLGRLSATALDVRGTQIDVFTYSKTDQVQSDMIAEAVSDILLATADFLDGLPVERYAFLFHFEDVSMGAWEHSYSSFYVYSEDTFSETIQNSIPSVVAHEFFHIVTPLNIHSELIEQFDFVDPKASEHLWLYEGTTEWAANVIRLRGGLIDLPTYLGFMRQKLMIDDTFDKTYSLSKLGKTSFGADGQSQYPNIYMRGALVSGLLDIRLLELSNGARGLRDVLLELSERFGTDQPFPEDRFFDVIVEMTYPEIADFFDSYIRNAEPLPIAEYFGLLGIDYTPEVDTGVEEAALGLMIAFDGGKFVFKHVSEEAAECGFVIGDEMLGFNGTEITMSNVQQVGAQIHAVEAGVDFEMKVGRGEETLDLTCAKYMSRKTDRHVLNVVENPTAQQLELREVWMTNRPASQSSLGTIE